MVSTEGIKTPRSTDVLLGRGAGVYNHNGNVVFRLVVENHKWQYAINNQKYRNVYARAMLEAVWCQDPPGRFLEKRKADGFWYEVDTKVAFKKAQQCLREPINKDTKTTSITNCHQKNKNRRVLSANDRRMQNMMKHFSAAIKAATASACGASVSSRRDAEETGGGYSSCLPTIENDDVALTSRRCQNQRDLSSTEIANQPKTNNYLDHKKEERSAPKDTSLFCMGFNLFQGFPKDYTYCMDIPTQNKSPKRELDDYPEVITAEDAVNIVDLVSRMSTTSFVTTNASGSFDVLAGNTRRDSSALRRSSRESNTRSSLSGITPIPIFSVPITGDFGDSPYSLDEQQPQLKQGYGTANWGRERRLSLMEDFDDSPLEARIRSWSKW